MQSAHDECEILANTPQDRISDNRVWVTVYNECERDGLVWLPGESNCPFCIAEVSFGEFEEVECIMLPRHHIKH